MGLYDDVYAAFEEADVRYVVVGGMAVVMSGHVRATVDLDVVVDLDPASAARSMQALAPVGDRVVPVAAKHHLIEMKRAAGRPRDLDDIAALQHLMDREHGRER